MSNEEMNYIDDLFREGLTSGQAPVNFNESHWDQLEQRLVRRENRKRAIFWLKPLSGVAALLLLAFSVWLLLPENQKIAEPQIAAEQQLPEQSGKPEITETLPGEQGSDKIGKPDSGTLAAKESDREIKPRLVSPEEQIAVEVTGPVREVALAMTTRESLPAELAMPEHFNVSRLEPVNKNKTVQQKSEMPLGEPVVPVPVPERKEHRLVLSVLAAPAYNGVNDLNNAKIGADAGLLVTMGLSKRWSISSGAVYAKKLYETGYENYNPRQDPGTYYDPETVDADCRVLDIPVDINYTVYDRHKKKISLGTGISSYLMLKENYRFIYAYQSTPEQEYEIRNGSKHWLSVLNFQMNYEKKLSSDFSIGLRPYLKIPFSDIGYGRVKLQSFGVALTANLGL